MFSICGNMASNRKRLKNASFTTMIIVGMRGGLMTFLSSTAAQIADGASDSSSRIRGMRWRASSLAGS